MLVFTVAVALCAALSYPDIAVAATAVPDCAAAPMPLTSPLNAFTVAAACVASARITTDTFLSPIVFLVCFESVIGFTLSHFSSGNTGIFPSEHIYFRKGRFASLDIIKGVERFQSCVVVKNITAFFNDGFDYTSLE
jgi:hypothetical protein